MLTTDYLPYGGFSFPISASTRSMNARASSSEVNVAGLARDDVLDAPLHSLGGQRRAVPQLYDKGPLRREGGGTREQWGSAMVQGCSSLAFGGVACQKSRLSMAEKS